nr:transmembrane protein 214-B-like [Cherax quadricarinatus]
MAAAGEWELVVKSSKKGKSATVPNGKLSKDEKKEFIQKAPRVTVTGGIERGVTGKENRKPKSSKAASAPKKKKTEKKTNSGPHQPGTVEEAICRLNVGEMQNLLDVVMSRFQESPLIWLKDLASYLNVRVNPIHQPDPAFRGHPTSFPASLLRSDVKMLLIKTLSTCNDNVLAAFHKHCLTSMVHEQVKGLGVAGYKVFIQILSIDHAHVGMVNLPYYCDLRNSIQNQTPACLSLLWAVGQSGLDDFTVGLKGGCVFVFFTAAFSSSPEVSCVALSHHVFVALGSRLPHLLIKVEDLDNIDPRLSMTPGLRRILGAPHMSRCSMFWYYALQSREWMILSSVFTSTEKRVIKDTNSSGIAEAQRTVASQSSLPWKEFSEAKEATNVMLTCREWKILSQSLRVQRKEVKDTIQRFAESNAQMPRKARALAGVSEAKEATNTLLNQMKTVKGKSPLPRVMKLLGILFVTAIIWDIKSAGSFYEREAGSMVKEVRRSDVSKESGGTLVPGAGDKTVPAVGTGAVEMSEEWSNNEVETSLPGLSTSVGHYGALAVESLEVTFFAIRNAFAPYFSQAHEFFTTRVFVGSLAPEKLKEYMIGAVDYLTQFLLRMHSNLVDVLQDTDSISNKTS